MEVKFWGQIQYPLAYEAMQAYTSARAQGVVANKTNEAKEQEAAQRADVLWICEHPAVFTQGLAGKPEHIQNRGGIALVYTDRGGQVTYHGPGQVVAYPLLDLKARGYFVKEYVYRLEEASIRCLAHFGITGHRVRGAPGIYVRLDEPSSHARLLCGNGQPLTAADLSTQGGIGKIAALGIKVSRHFTYHGLALNVAMDLSPYQGIHPCGYRDLPTVDMAYCGVQASWNEVAQVLAEKLVAHL